MTTTTHNRQIVLFLTVSAFILGLCFLITQSSYYLSNNDVFSLAITIDIIFFIPLIYFLLIRKRKTPKITIIPVVILSYIAASFLIPSSDHGYLEKAKILLAPLELLAMGYIIYKVRLTAKQYQSFTAGSHDFLKNLRGSLYKTLGEHRASDLIATEISVFYYGLLGWTSEIEIDSGKVFSYHKRSGYSIVVGVFLFLIILETFLLHLLISKWSPVGAWILTALSIYGIFFLFADYNAARKRPILIDNHTLQIKIGIRWFVTIPYENISQIAMGVEPDNNDKNYFRMVLVGSENIIIKLKEPMTSKGFYGISKTFTRLGLSIDNKEEFYTLIKSKISGP